MRRFVLTGIIFSLLITSCQHTSNADLSDSEFQIEKILKRNCGANIRLEECSMDDCSISYSFIHEYHLGQCLDVAGSEIKAATGRTLSFKTDESSLSQFAGVMVIGLTVGVLTYAAKDK
ncbi:MAG: hypothetical protein EOP04_22110 [Proteobacteria bacterium]|nr:MAG: hypothetical protein EOP04_22110 [Pseudomonadota bacterium]